MDLATVSEGQLSAFRSLRAQLEASVLPLATSIDGLRFSFQASLHGLELRVGAYVVLEHPDGRRLGQVLSLELAQRDGTEVGLPPDKDGAASVRTQVPIRHALGEGTVLEGGPAPFHDAMLRLATPDEVRAWQARARPRRAALEIGELALVPGVPCTLDAGGFNRHTFLCGQSGSGKTYSLGVVLERLLMETGLRIVILDPNSDFVRLTNLRADAQDDVAERYREAVAGLQVHTARPGGESRLRLRLAELAPSAQAALLRLDPIADGAEHAELTALLHDAGPTTLEDLLADPRPEGVRLAQRARNLGVDAWAVWARAQAGSVLEVVRDPAAARCLVVDLGSLGSSEEQALVAGAVLDSLWRHREDRQPVLIVIDEAHNVCPAEPEDALTALAARITVRIAAEGRKFGLYLLVSTQRPQKVHQNVISQCDNLILMRLNSEADAAFARSVFSFVPGSLVDRATTFGLGEALVAGNISRNPALVRFGARFAEEGGADVPTTWATPAAP